MSVWTKFRDEFEAIFVTDSGKLADFLKPWAAKLEAEGRTVLIDAATSAVAVGEGTPGTGEAKMLAALAAFSATCVAESLPYVESEARALIEVALQNLRSTLAAA